VSIYNLNVFADIVQCDIVQGYCSGILFRDEKKIGGAGHGQLFLVLAQRKVEKALISPVMCGLWSGRLRSTIRVLRSLFAPSMAQTPYSFVWRNQAFSNLPPELVQERLPVPRPTDLLLWLLAQLT
jgi:hypothetical protein